MEPILSWSALTRPKHERSRLWYIVTGSITAVLLIYSVQTASWSFTVLILMCAAVYYFLGIRAEPTVQQISIFEEGIQLGYEFFPWGKLLGFWFQRYHQYTQLHIEHREAWCYDLIIQTGPVSVANIRTVLSKHLPEHAHRSERILDTITRICKI